MKNRCSYQHNRAGRKKWTEISAFLSPDSADEELESISDIELVSQVASVIDVSSASEHVKPVSVVALPSIDDQIKPVTQMRVILQALLSENYGYKDVLDLLLSQATQIQL